MSREAVACRELYRPVGPGAADKVGELTDQTAERQTRNLLLGTVSAVLLGLGFSGFIPAYYVGFVQGRWFFDAVHQINLPKVRWAEWKWGARWSVLILIHTISAILWVTLSAFQIATGATGQPGGKRKAWHRVNGYIAAFTALLFVLEALLLQHLSPEMDPPIVINGLLIPVNLGLGIYYARRKEYSLHKWAMAWTCAWSATPGLLRVTAYALVTVWGGCRVDSAGFFASGGSVIVMCVMCLPHVILKEVRTRLFAFNALAFATGIAMDAFASLLNIYEHGWCTNYHNPDFHGDWDQRMKPWWFYFYK